MKAICNKGCQLEFNINGFITVDISDKVEKTYFECEHCKHEYIVFYTDPEIRDLQEQIRQVHRGILVPDGQAAAIKKEEEIKTLIKEKMEVLRTQYNEQR
ncbi:hypothetical protein [Paenibacillus gallinarum]|uniref:Transglycosylase n=1 Tax=Paenibacillus gallinarum TaxID=2762232 RepID=A0ABR8SWQ6_9BACL|nr:hypothetical protein [Paenibacillus gallinarum]MBD7967753.1 hypothetical protein [Paenibacillus gallinarum]